MQLFSKPHHLLLLCVAAGIVAGCGKSTITTVPVTGTITFNGGDWPSSGMVIFAPKTPVEGYPRRGGEAMFGKDGQFQASTFLPKDGLIPGTYLVNLRCFESSAEDITKGTNHVPEKYRRGDTSGFEVVVPADDSQPVIVELNVPSN